MSHSIRHFFKRPPPRRPGLLLDRKVGQSVILQLPDSGQVIVTLTESKHGRAKIHLAAPPAVVIYREELGAFHRKPAA
jgi:sRNA-binding carbon storage regulator CsrA